MLRVLYLFLFIIIFSFSSYSQSDSTKNKFVDKLGYSFTFDNDVSVLSLWPRIISISPAITFNHDRLRIQIGGSYSLLHTLQDLDYDITWEFEKPLSLFGLNGGFQFYPFNQERRLHLYFQVKYKYLFKNGTPVLTIIDGRNKYLTVQTHYATLGYGLIYHLTEKLSLVQSLRGGWGEMFLGYSTSFLGRTSELYWIFPMVFEFGMGYNLD